MSTVCGRVGTFAGAWGIPGIFDAPPPTIKPMPPSIHSRHRAPSGQRPPVPLRRCACMVLLLIAATVALPSGARAQAETCADGVIARVDVVNN